ncbi:hypothetical protein V1498_15940 [Peribacillus sp. SCS-26]|uniref:hypothetical protein n=1 Tax=Paraperibacillus marinus TaxID=3115295 RepID=UPI003905EFA4
MKNNAECLVFLQELDRLLDEYKRCSFSHLKEAILADIQLISKAIGYTRQQL